MFRAFLKNSTIYAIPTFISRGLSLFLIPIYTRVLSPEDFGSLDLLLVFAGLINLTVSLEVSQGVARFYRSEPSVGSQIAYASSGLWFTLICYTVFALLCFYFSSFLATFVMGREGLESAFQAGICYIWINGIYYLLLNQFRWEHRSLQYAQVSLVVAFSTAGMAVFLTYGLHWGLLGLLSGMAFGAILGVVMSLYLLRQTFRFQLDAQKLKEMLVFSSPLVISGIAVIISTYIDRIMINHFLSVSDVGLYGVGFRLAGIVGLFMAGFQGAFTPLVYKHYQNVDTPRQMARIFRVFIAFSLLVFMLLVLFANDILALLTTPEYYSASQVVVFLVPAILLSQMYIFAPGIGIAKKTHLIIWVNLMGAAVNTLLNWLMIPPYGITGAAIASLVAYSCVFLVYITLSQRLYRVPHQWTRMVIATILTSLIVWVVPMFSFESMGRVLVNLSALFVVVGIIIFTGLIQLSELLQLKKIVRKKIF